MLPPRSLVITMFFIMIGFLISYSVVVQEKKKTSDSESYDYQYTPQQPSNEGATITSSNYGAVSQGSNDQRYTTRPKAVSYCLIDGRLIDR